MLLKHALQYHVDAALFVVAVAGAAWVSHRRVPEDVRGIPYPRIYLPALGVLVLMGIVAAHLSGENERRNLARVLQGLAPTFAAEMVEMGLKELGPGTRPDDPAYLRIVEAQKRWLAANASVADIYSAVLSPDDRVLLIADSETDYNRDGDTDDPREERIPIGLELQDVYGEFHAAMLGDLRFGENPHHDAWGFWVTAYVNPGKNRDGMPIMVGVDYQASDWLRQILQQRALMLLLFTLISGACISVGRSARLTQADVIRERETRQKLQVASETAEAASLAKGTFLASISHEIRTPMNGVLGMLELLRSTPLTEEQHEFLDTAYESGTALLEILNDVLDYSKAESGMLRFDTVECNLRTLVRDITGLHTAIARARGLTTAIHVAPDVPGLVGCDPFRLRQVLNNLISNALKFTTEGGISLIVERNAQQSLPAEVELRFSVRDSGLGIPPGKQALIFEPFTQGDQSTSRRFGGTGLGLAICKRLITMMGGQIGVESAEGIGSIFWFTLPVRVIADEVPSDAGRRPARRAGDGGPDPRPAPVVPAAPAAAPTAPAAPQPARAAGTDARQPGSGGILVVEDNEVNQLVTSGMLKRLGYGCEIAADGAEALARLAASHYSAVLMDMQMPDIDGLEATRRWRAREAGGETRVPIIAMTANVLQGDRERCLEAGMDDFIGKPVVLEELRRILERHAGSPGRRSG